ncbi:MAG: hypothetical protein RLP15_11945 [Cryomorphaceae bacterium]
MRSLILYALTAFFSFQSFYATAQDLLAEYTWDDRDWYAMVDRESDSDVQILLREKDHEFYFTEQSLEELYFFRSVVYLNSEQAVSDFNKIYINTSNAIQLVDYNARVIYKDKEPKNFGSDALKSGTTEEGDSYEFFAIEGAEVGAIIDYYFAIKKHANYDGTHFQISTSSPIHSYRCRLISPPGLIFSATPINGDLAIYRDTTDTNHRVLRIEADSLPAVKGEPFSNIARYNLTCFYKLQDNLYSSSHNLFTYGTLSQRIYENLISVLDKKTMASIKKDLKKAGVDTKATDLEKLRQIEDHFKGTIGVTEASAPGLSDVETILKNRVCSEYGMTLLLFGAARLHDIQSEIVLTKSRYDVPFVDSIVNYSLLEHYLLYYPSVQEFTAPKAQLYRIGTIPFGYIHNNGLFIREVKVGDFMTGAGSVKWIPEYEVDHSRHDMWVDVEFEDDVSNVLVKMREEMTGYNAINYQPYYDYISPDGLQDLQEASVKSVAEEAEIVEVEIENEGVANFLKEPYRVKSSYRNSNLIQVAGNKVLFKVGDLIGPQAELYQEEKRMKDVENTYNHGYYREISFSIPEGFRCTNLDDLNMEVRPFSEGHTYFTSAYRVELDKVVVIVKEDYNALILPIERFEDFRKVINAASDFNKITLVFEKE